MAHDGSDSERQKTISDDNGDGDDDVQKKTSMLRSVTAVWACCRKKPGGAFAGLPSRSADRLRALIDDFEVAQWLSVVPHPYSLDDAVAFLARLADEEPLVWGIDDGALCGVMPGWRQSSATGSRATAGGRATAPRPPIACSAGIFSEGEGTDVVAGHFLDNTRSARVLEKLGFVPTGFRRIPCRARGHDMDSRAMRLTRAAFLAAPRPGATGGAR